MIGTGFMKWSPMNRSIRFVDDAWAVIEMLDVLEAKIVDGLHALSSS